MNRGEAGMVDRELVGLEDLRFHIVFARALSFFVMFVHPGSLGLLLDNGRIRYCSVLCELGGQTPAEFCIAARAKRFDDHVRDGTIIQGPRPGDEDSMVAT